MKILRKCVMNSTEFLADITKTMATWVYLYEKNRVRNVQNVFEIASGAWENSPEIWIKSKYISHSRVRRKKDQNFKNISVILYPCLYHTYPAYTYTIVLLISAIFSWILIFDAFFPHIIKIIFADFLYWEGVWWKKDQKEERKKRKIADLFLQNHIIDFNETFFFFHKKVSTLHRVWNVYLKWNWKS